jgi:hypothetical protein
MCTDNTPLYLGLLYALRLESDPESPAAEAWLAFNGLTNATAPVRALADLLASGGHFAPPSEKTAWPHELAVLEALARIDREPDEAEALLTFLPRAKRTVGLALLAELSHRLCGDLSARLRQPSAREPGVVH